jgi:hypothetical protein
LDKWKLHQFNQCSTIGHRWLLGWRCVTHHPKVSIWLMWHDTWMLMWHEMSSPSFLQGVSIISLGWLEHLTELVDARPSTYRQFLLHAQKHFAESNRYPTIDPSIICEFSRQPQTFRRI